MSGTITAPPGWYGFQASRDLCGIGLADDTLCDRKRKHVEDEVAAGEPIRHVAHDPSGTGSFVEFDDDGTVTKRHDGPYRNPEASPRIYTEADLRRAFVAGWHNGHHRDEPGSPTTRRRAFDAWLAIDREA